jgi:3-oxoacyl-[acyl-carrier-protein] synthase II
MKTMNKAALTLGPSYRPKDQKKLDRFIRFGLAAADEAISQALWIPSEDSDRERTATIIASGIGGIHSIMTASLDTESKWVRRLSPFDVPSFLSNMTSKWVSIRHGFKGPLGAPTTACAAGIQAIGDGARMIRAGEVDIAICGGAAACINRVSLGGFATARALSTGFNDQPEQASRPFDSGRDGFVMGKGAGIVVLETLEHAREPIAELVGYGTSADAYSLSGAPEDGNGAQRAMRIALRQAGVDPGVVGYSMLMQHRRRSVITASLGLLDLFGVGDPLDISSTKSATGHLLGAAGGLDTVFTLFALRDGLIPPKLNLDDPDPLADGLDLL